jgi:hypothetical protein
MIAGSTLTRSSDSLADRNPSRLILAEQLGGQSSARLILEIDKSELLSGADNKPPVTKNGAFGRSFLCTIRPKG